MLTKVIDHNTHLAPVAHYYLCHNIVQETRVKSNEHKTRLYTHIARAMQGFKSKIMAQATFAAAIETLSAVRDTPRCSVVHSDNYAAQKQDVIKLYNLFEQSLENITGREINERLVGDLKRLQVSWTTPSRSTTQ